VTTTAAASARYGDERIERGRTALTRTCGRGLAQRQPVGARIPLTCGLAARARRRASASPRRPARPARAAARRAPAASAARARRSRRLCISETRARPRAPVDVGGGPTAWPRASGAPPLGASRRAAARPTRQTRARAPRRRPCVYALVARGEHEQVGARVADSSAVASTAPANGDAAAVPRPRAPPRGQRPPRRPRSTPDSRADHHPPDHRTARAAGPQRARQRSGPCGFKGHQRAHRQQHDVVAGRRASPPRRPGAGIGSRGATHMLALRPPVFGRTVPPRSRGW
jgi:hypothetical protein